MALTESGAGSVPLLREDGGMLPPSVWPDARSAASSSSQQPAGSSSAAQMGAGKNGKPDATIVTGREAAYRSAIGLYFQAVVMVAYMLCAFLLPIYTDVWMNATHVAALHCAASVLLAIATAACIRYASASRVIAGFPFGFGISSAQLLAAVAVNAILLPILSMQTWLQSEVNSSMSVILIVQMLAGIEAATSMVCIMFVSVRYRRFLQSLTRTNTTLASASLDAAAPFDVLSWSHALDRAGAVGAQRPLHMPGPLPSQLYTPTLSALRGANAGMDVEMTTTRAALSSPEYQQGEMQWAMSPNLRPGAAGDASGGAADHTPAPHTLPASGAAYGLDPATVAQRLNAYCQREYELLHRVMELSKELVAASAGTPAAEWSAGVASVNEQLVSVSQARSKAEDDNLLLREKLLAAQNTVKRNEAEVAKLAARVRDLERETEKQTQNISMQQDRIAQLRSLVQQQQQQLSTTAMALAPPLGPSSYNLDAAGGMGDAEDDLFSSGTDLAPPSLMATSMSGTANIAIGPRRGGAAAASRATSAKSSLLAMTSPTLSSSMPQAPLMMASLSGGLAYGSAANSGTPGSYVPPSHMSGMSGSTGGWSATMRS